MTRRTVFLATKAGRQRAHALIDAAEGDDVMKIGKVTRSDEQNRKLWPMLNDIRRQVPGAIQNAEHLKCQFLNALGVEMTFLPTLESEGMFPMGMHSSTLTVAQFSGLIELLYAFGAKHGVEWTDPETRNQAEAA